MSFASMSAELTGAVPGLSPFLADNFVTRAWADVRRERLWSFLQEDCGIVCPTQVVAGSVAITQFSNTVTCDATASAALLAIALPSPLDLTAMQIRFGGSGNAGFVGQIYSITAFDDSTPAALVLTLDRVVFQATNATSGYQCYRCYIKPTQDDFLKWQMLIDMTNGWYLRTDYSSSFFDMRDPQRMAQGLSYFIGGFKGNPEDQPRPQYELWPHPTSGQTFYGRFRRMGEDFATAATELPQIVPESLVLHRAYGWYVCEWAAKNQIVFPRLKVGGTWVTLMLAEQKNYRDQLVAVKRQDDEQELQTVFSRGHGLVHKGAGFKGISNFPIDSNFMQSHLVQL